MIPEPEVRAAITALETQRCAALMRGDVVALHDLVADDLVHVHGNGAFDGKDDYLRGVAEKYTFHSVARGDLNVRRYGDAVVVMGPLEQVVSVNGADARNRIKAICTQVWVRSGAAWRQNTCHMGFLSVEPVE